MDDLDKLAAMVESWIAEGCVPGRDADHVLDVAPELCARCNGPLLGPTRAARTRCGDCGAEHLITWDGVVYFDDHPPETTPQGPYRTGAR